MEGSRKKRGEASQKFDALYRNATKVFAAQSLADALSAVQNNPQKVLDFTKSEASCLNSACSMGSSISEYSTGDYPATRDKYPSGLTSWSTTDGYGFDHRVNYDNWYGDWYDWWNRRRDDRITFHYTWPDFSSLEIKKLLEEIRDSLKEAPPNKLSGDLVSSSYPPSNVSINDDGDLVVEVALAGFKKDQITVMIQDEKLIVKFDRVDRTGLNLAPIQRGIKLSDGEVSFFVDQEKFDKDDVKVVFEDCILTVVIGKLKTRSATVIPIG